LALEPEGDVIMLEPGTTCSVRFPDLGDSDDADLEISWEEGLLSIHLSATKQVWIDDKRVRWGVRPGGATRRMEDSASQVQVS